jgi:hypothetical protein
MVLVASRFNPTENTPLFLNTAIAITPISDAISQSHKTEDYFKQSTELQSGNIYIVHKSTTITGSGENKEKTINLTQDYLRAFATIYEAVPCVCNFTVPFPDQLPDENGILTRLEIGEEIFLSIIRGMKIEVKSQLVDNELNNDLWIGITQDSLANKYNIERNSSTGETTKIVSQGQLDEKFSFIEDSERRFSLTIGCPADSAIDTQNTIDGQINKSTGWIGGTRVKSVKINQQKKQTPQLRRGHRLVGQTQLKSRSQRRNTGRKLF